MRRLRGLIHAELVKLSGRRGEQALGLLGLVLVLDYADRSLVGALGPTLKQAFDISNVQLGLLAAAFSIVGAGATLPFGALTDRVSRTAMLALSLALWSVAVGLVGAAATFGMLFGARLLLSVVAAATGPVTPSLVGDLVPASRRSEALGLISAGQLVGGGFGFALPVILAAFLSWRWNFWLLAIAGAALALAFWRAGEPARTGPTGPADDSATAAGVARARRGEEIGREARIVESRDIAPSAGAILTQSPAAMSLMDAARYVIRVRTDVVVLVARSVGDFFFQGISTFAVVFATGWYAVSQSRADLAILLIATGALIGTLMVSRLGDVMVQRGMLNGRLWISSIGYMLATLAAYPAFLTHSLPVALVFFTLAAFFIAGAGPPLDAVRIDVLVPELRGRSEAIRQVLRTIAEGGAPLLIGLLASSLAGGAKGLQLAFLITLPALALNGLIMLVALRTYQPDIAAAVVSSERLAGQNGEASLDRREQGIRRSVSLGKKRD